MKTLILSAASLVLAASSAHATTFSFASDDDHTSWTFRGFRASLSDAQDLTDRVRLLVDDDNGSSPALAFDVEFRFVGDLSHVASVPLGGGLFLHTYSIVAPQGVPFFGFFNPDGSALLTASFQGGVFSAVGTASSWDSSAGLSAADITGAVTYTWHGADLPAYGLFSGASSIGQDDAAFTLTNLNHGGSPGAPLGLQSPYPDAEWASEGSYSGTAHFVPSPGAFALAGLGVLLTGRRKR